MRIPRARTYSGYPSLLQRFDYETITLFGWASHPTRLRIHNAYTGPLPRRYCYPRFSLFRVRSPLLTESRLISLPPPT